MKRSLEELLEEEESREEAEEVMLRNGMRMTERLITTEVAREVERRPMDRRAREQRTLREVIDNSIEDTVNTRLERKSSTRRRFRREPRVRTS